MASAVMGPQGGPSSPLSSSYSSAAAPREAAGALALLRALVAREEGLGLTNMSSSVAVQEAPSSPPSSGFGMPSVKALLDVADGGRPSVDMDEADALAQLRDVRMYVDAAAAEPLEARLREPQALRAKRKEITENMQALAWEHYSTFVEASDCVHSVVTDSALVSGHAARLLDECLPSTTGAVQQFVSRSQDLRKKKDVARGTLAHHGSLLELLELPSMMESCVKAGLYDSALALDAYSVKLVRAFPQSRVVAGIREQMISEGRTMLSQLLAQLRSDVQLPQCLKVIGLLRRLGSVRELGIRGSGSTEDPEYQLRKIFLNSRGFWLQRTLNSVPQSNPYTHLTKLTDASRTHLFDIITQYRAIFSVDASSTASTTPDSLLHTWIADVVTKYVAVVSENLPFINEGLALSNLLDQCMYYGLSLARVGADFRPLLVPHFEAAVLRIFSSTLKAASAHFADSLRSESAAVPTEVDEAFSRVGADTSALSPPAELLRHAPVAVLCNGYLSALNELRHCAPVQLRGQLAGLLSDSMSSGATAVATLVLRHEQLAQQHAADRPNDSRLKIHDESMREDLTSLAFCFAKVMLPFIARCFASIYGCSDTMVSIGGAQRALEPHFANFAGAKVANPENLGQPVG